MVRWGIIGTGNIANKFARAVKNADGGVAVAVASRSMDKSREFANKHGIENCFASYEELLCSDMIDAVYIALPHVYHTEYSIRALRAGKHVLSEKPIAVDCEELERLEKEQKSSGKFVMEALWTRFLPVTNKLKELCSEGEIGEVLEVRADFCYNYDDRTHQIFDKDRAGGSLLDVGIYCLNFASIILGDEVDDVKATAFVNCGIDERLNVTLSYKNGAHAVLSSAITLNKPADAYVFGTKGRIHIPTFYGAKEMTLYKDNGECVHYSLPFKGNGFEEEIEEVNRAVKSGKTQSDIMPLSQSKTITTLMDKIKNQVGIDHSTRKM